MTHITSVGEADIYFTPPKPKQEKISTSSTSQQVNEWATDAFPLPMTPPSSPVRVHSLIPSPVRVKKGMTLLPGEQSFASPVKRKREPEKFDDKRGEPAQKKLFYTINEIESQTTLTSPLKQQCALITALNDEKEIQQRIESILSSSLTPEQKHAELGVLYFYLTRDKSLSNLPEEGYFLEIRYNEIKKRLLEDVSIHEGKCPEAFSSLVPSGKVVGLIRPFIRLVFTQNGTFNPGGCEAVKQLLNTDLINFITEEIRAQILTIVEKLLTDENFHKRFLKEHPSIHPDAAEFIRVDLFLKPGDAVGNLHACWAKLTSCFSVICQINEGNCFAVALVLDFYRRHPELILDLFDQLIEKGTFTFEGIEVPAALLTEGRKIYEKDFNKSLNLTQAADLSSVVVVHQLFGKEISSSSSRKTTLGNIFNEQFESDESDAKLRYLAFKQNLFQQSILALFQFVSNNTSLNTTIEFSYKHDFLVDLLNKFPSYGRQKKFYTRFYMYLKDFFWFVDYRNGSGEISGDRIYFPYNSQGLLMDSDEESDFKRFSVIRRLFFLKQGQFVSIDTLTELKKCVSELFSTFVKANNENNAIVKKVEKFISDASSFIKCLAETVSDLNKSQNIPFSWQKYRKSDAFILASAGGFPALIIKWASQVGNFNYKSIALNKNKVDSLFTDLCQKIKKHVDKYPSFLKEQNPTLTIDAHAHTFILCPLLFEQFFKVDNPQKLLKQKVFDPAQQLKKRAITNEFIEKLLHEAFDTSFAKKMLKQLPKGISTARQLYSSVKKIVSKRRLEQFNESFSTMLVQISCEEFVQKLPDLLAHYQITTDPSQLDEIISLIKKEVLQPSTAGKLAESIHKALLTCTHIFISAHSIENTLADLFNLPYVIKIGNLNWVETFSEAPEHILLVIKLNIITNKYVFCTRKHGEDTDFDHDLASNLLTEENILSLAL